MKFRTGFLLGAVVAAVSASAGTYDFSYEFDNGLKVSGSLSGTRVGDVIEQPHSFSLLFDHRSVHDTAGLVNFGLVSDSNIRLTVFSTAGQGPDALIRAGTMGATVDELPRFSFEASQNSFWIGTDAEGVSGKIRGMFCISDGYAYGKRINDDFLGDNEYTPSFGLFGSGNSAIDGRWSLTERTFTEVAAIPEPQTTVLAAFGLLLFAYFRHAAAQKNAAS